MSIRLIYRHIKHHARCSGYDQLVKYVDGEAFRESGLGHRLSQMMRWRRLKRIPYYRSAWYGGPALRREIDICLKMLAPRKTLYRFLCAEKGLAQGQMYLEALSSRRELPDPLMRGFMLNG